MRVLIVFCHPYEESFGAAMLERATTTLTNNDHETQTLDLYREGFDPVLSRKEWLGYLTETDKNIATLQDHVDALRWAEGIVLIYPTWMYGPPAMLKGWMERVWLPGVAFDLAPERKQGLKGRLKNIRLFSVLTTSGSPKWWLWLIRNPGRNMLMRGQRALFHPRCRMRWLQLYDMDRTSPEQRARFLTRIESELSKI